MYTRIHTQTLTHAHTHTHTVAGTAPAVLDASQPIVGVFLLRTADGEEAVAALSCRYRLHTLHHTLQTTHYILHTMRSKINATHYTLHTIYCKLHTAKYTPQNAHNRGRLVMVGRRVREHRLTLPDTGAALEVTVRLTLTLALILTLLPTLT
jgi:hypothetical protein